MTIGSRIKELRESNHLTQTELAEKLGTTKQTIYKYENGIITNIPLIVKGVDRRKANAADSDRELAELLGL